MQPRRIENLESMRDLARELVESFRHESRVLWLIDGPMGAGKTQLTRFLVEELGSLEATSPSFALHNSYQTGSRVVEHFDLFRLKSAIDLESTGFWDVFQVDAAWVVIEWADRLTEFGVENHLPKAWLTQRIRIQIGRDEHRVVTL